MLIIMTSSFIKNRSTCIYSMFSKENVGETTRNLSVVIKHTKISVRF